MRVCHVISGIDIDNGGPPVALGGLAAAQVRVGLEVSVLSSYRFGEKSFAVAEDWEKRGILVRLIGPAKNPMSRHPGLTPAAEAMARSHDVFHIHSMWESIQHKAARAAFCLGTPYVYRPSGMLDPWNMSNSALRKNLYLALRARKNLNRAAAIHYTTPVERDWCARLALNPPTIVEPLGINISEFDRLPARDTFRSRYPQLAQRPVIMFLGRIHSGKGLELLIPALAMLNNRDAMLVIVGPDGDFRAQANALIAEHRLQERVLFTGLLSGIDRLSALTDAELLALPSYHENFGLVVIESLACGTPVVVSDQVGLHPEIAAQNVGGVVPMNPPALAKELDRWLADDALRRAAAQRGPPWVRERFDWDKIAARWADHYSEIAAKRGDVPNPAMKRARHEAEGLG